MKEAVQGADSHRWVDVLPARWAPFEPGWYLLQPDPDPDCGQWMADHIRASQGGSQPVALSSLAPARKAVVLFSGSTSVAKLRLVDGVPPSVRPRLKVRRIGRSRAFCAMLSTIAYVDMRAAIHAAVEFMRTGLVYGLSAAAESLLACYRAAIGGPVWMGRPRQIWRLRRGALRLQSDRLLLEPVAQLAVDASQPEAVAWEATGSSPRFIVTRADGKAPILEAGWYRLRGRITTTAGKIVAPCFCLRYANHQAQPLPVQIRMHEPAADGRIDMSIRFTHDVNALRFDPSVRPLRFAMVDFRLRKMGRLEWMTRLLAGLRRDDGQRDWRGAAISVFEMLVLVAQGRRRDAGEALAKRYLETSDRHAGSYAAWVRRYDTLSAADLAAMARRGEVLATAGPKISLILPVFQTPERWLRRCIDSVLAQAYPNWELCIADDASPSRRVREVLCEYQQRDPRIRVVFRERNGHIAAASNSALELARGEYIGLLDHDDELRPHALLEMAEALAAQPELEMAYSDEDKIDETGRRFEPYFKPDWNPDLLLSQNYVCHFTVIRTRLAREAGGFRAGFEGSQDHDLFLRCSRELSARQIHHVPAVLYHWRAIPGSTAFERGAKDYASSAGMRAVAEHARAVAPGALVDELPHGHYRVRWPVPEPQPKVSIIIPTRDRAALLHKCVESVLEKTTYANFELVVADNQSSEPEATIYLDMLRLRERVTVLSYDAPFNYSAINNWAAAHCDGEFLCLLNNDIEVIDRDWLEEMVGHASRPGIGAVGAMLLYPDGSIQHAGVILGLGGVANHAYCHQPAGYPGHGARAMVAQNLSAVTGACLLVRRAVFDQVGGLDERLQVAFNDIDFCLRVRQAGYRNLWTPFARLYHHESASRGADDSAQKIDRFHGEVRLMKERWGECLEHDPAYNPNLSLGIDDTSSELAFPPRKGGAGIH